MKQLQKSLQSISKSLQTLSKKIQNIQKQIESEQKPAAKTKGKSVKRPTVKKATRIKPAKQDASGTAYALFLKIIGEAGTGISKADLKVKTGFDGKKVANLVFKAKKKGKIKAASRGVYVKA